MSFLIFIIPLNSSATHLIGGDIQVDQLSYGNGSGTYLITLKVFRDCTPGTYEIVDVSEVRLFSSTTNLVEEVIDMNDGLVNQQVLSLGDSCYSPDICVEQYIFQKVIEISDNPDGYYVIWSSCCRNELILNLSNPLDDGMAIYTDIPNPALTGGNSSPHFGPYPTYGYLCVNDQNQLIDFNISDPDGDSLVFSLVDCLDENYSKPFYNCGWALGYSVTNILGNAPPFTMTIDSQTGLITCYPTQVGVFVFSVLVEEYRNGIKIGQAVRDVQYQVLDCPTSSSPLILDFEGPSSSDTIIEGCAPGKVRVSRLDNQTDLEVDLIYYGSASYGIDYNSFPMSVTIPAGNYSVEIPIQGIEDTLVEGIENIIFLAEAQSEDCSLYEASSVEIFINDHYSIELNTTGDNILCKGDPATFVVEVIGGEPEYGITWEFGEHDSIVTFTPWEDGYFQVAVSDANGCITIDSAYVEITGEVEPNAGLDTVICFGTQVQLGGNLLNPTGPNGSSYVWQPPLLDSAGVANPTTQIWETTEFSVEVTSPDGCVETDYVRIEIYQTQIELSDTIICSGDSIQLSMDGNESASYLWNPSVGLSSDTIANPIAAPDDPITYSLITTSEYGCTSSDSLMINVHEALMMDITTQHESLACNGLELELLEQSGLGMDYVWIIGEDTTYSSSVGYGVIPYGGGEIQLLMLDSNGCKTTEVIQMPLEELSEYINVEVPNVFTPNNDGMNDVFKAEVNGNYTSCSEMKVYNRWGNLLFESCGHVINWDGFTTSGEKAPSGTYFYILTVGGEVFSGSLMLLRE